MSLELTLLFFLLPAAFLSGWWIGKHNKRRPEKHREAFSSGYFKGLNYLLNEQQDKAIDVFVQMLEVDSETVETHLALGNLFRRRGEGDRAIRIHQNLIARPTLSKDQRARALLELGQDYLRAGMLGRAEALFLELIEQGLYQQEALERLLDIYQQEKEWSKAIDTAKRLERNGGPRMGVLISHFYCEQAEAWRQKGDIKPALKCLKQALVANKEAVRASLLKAEIEQQMGRHKLAIKTLSQVEQQDADFIPEAVPLLLKSYEALGQNHKGERYLRHLLQRYGGITPLLAVVDLVQEEQGERAAAKLVIKYLRERPSVRGLDKLIELQLKSGQGELQENLLILKELADKLLQEKTPYRCRNCGFGSKALCWQCPGCKQWNSIRPVQGVSGE